jgi:hypothetical protein
MNDMVLALVSLVDLGDAGAAFGAAARTGEDTADAATTLAVPISTFRRDTIKVDELEVAGMIILQMWVRDRRTLRSKEALGCGLSNHRRFLKTRDSSFRMEDGFAPGCI